MEQPGDWVLDELNKRVLADSLIEKSRSGRVTGYTEITASLPHLSTNRSEQIHAVSQRAGLGEVIEVTLLCCRAAKRQNFAAAPRLLQKIRPVLHHPRARLRIECMVVGGTDLIAWSMGQLNLNVVVVIALLVQDGGRQATETMSGHTTFVAHPLSSEGAGETGSC